MCFGFRVRSSRIHFFILWGRAFMEKGRLLRAKACVVLLYLGMHVINSINSFASINSMASINSIHSVIGREAI